MTTDRPSPEYPGVIVFGQSQAEEPFIAHSGWLKLQQVTPPVLNSDGPTAYDPPPAIRPGHRLHVIARPELAEEIQQRINAGQCDGGPVSDYIGAIIDHSVEAGGPPALSALTVVIEGVLKIIYAIAGPKSNNSSLDVPRTKSSLLPYKKRVLYGSLSVASLSPGSARVIQALPDGNTYRAPQTVGMEYLDRHLAIHGLNPTDGSIFALD